MNEIRYIVSWHLPGFVDSNKIYKYRKSAFDFAIKLKFIFDEDAEITVETQKRKDGKWAMLERCIL